MPKWRKDSVFGPGRRRPLDRNQRARVGWLVKQDRRHGRLTASGEDVGLALLKMLGEDGQLDPSHATLAACVGCKVSTVQRSLNRMRELGRLSWERRLRRDSATGWRCEQTSNAYVLCPDCDIHSAREAGLARLKKEARQESKPESGRPETDFESAARQLRALGYPVPVAWGLE